MEMYRGKLSRVIIVVGLTVLAALVLNILPLPKWAIWLRPEWLVLVIIYWVMALPHRISVGVAWLIGLLADTLNGTVLGQHALAFTVVAYLTVKFHRQIRVFPLWQQAIAVTSLVAVYQMVLLVIKGMQQQLVFSYMYTLSLVTSLLIWPWLFIILRDIRRRFSVR